jgi:hypothetical protein
MNDNGPETCTCPICKIRPSDLDPVTGKPALCSRCDAKYNDDEIEENRRNRRRSSFRSSNRSW